MSWDTMVHGTGTVPALYAERIALSIQDGGRRYGVSVPVPVPHTGIGIPVLYSVIRYSSIYFIINRPSVVLVLCTRHQYLGIYRSLFITDSTMTCNVAMAFGALYNKHADT